MVLAAISFADPLMLAGLLAALVPIALHLLNRMRAPVVAFPTLRFLKITAQKTARRRHLQQYFLLLVRIVVFALVAMAVAAPLIHGGSPVLAYGFVGMLLGGLGLLVLALVLSSTAIDAVKSTAAPAAAGTRPPSPPGALGAPAPKSTAPLWGFSLVAAIAALVLGGYAGYGLISDRYFAADRGGIFTGESTAMVIIFDNSHSMLAADGTPPAPPRLARAKTLVRQLVGESVQPREAALLPTNPGATAGVPTFTSNMFVLAGNLEKLSPEGSARPMQERIRTALEMLRTSQQPSRMLVIVSDFARPGYTDADVFAALKNEPQRADLQVVLMPVRKAPLNPATGADEAAVPDVGIASFDLAEGTQRPVVGAEVTFEAQILNNGNAADVRDLAFTVDGKPVDAGAGGGAGGAANALNPRVQLGAAGTGSARTTVRIPYRLTDAGTHRFGLQLQNAPDAMAWDDSRELALDVADQIKVLVVGAESGAAARPRSAAFYFQAALAPFEGAPGKTIPWSVKPTYRGVDQVQSSAALQGYAAVFLCDVPKISAPLADALVTYAKGGGRIIWVLGPSVDSTSYNQVLLGAGPGGPRGLLPAPLAQPLVAAQASPLDWVDIRSGLFMNLFDSQDPFRNALITGRWSLADVPGGGGGGGRALAKLADGSPLFLQHAAGSRGQVYTLLTSPGAEWSNLGSTVLLVPLASRMALGDFQEAGGGTSFETGQSVPLHIPALDGAAPAALRAMSLDVTTPGQAVINVKSAVSGNTSTWSFDRTMAAGLYTWKSSDGKHAGSFVVNPPGQEADLFPADMGMLARQSSPPADLKGGKETLVAYNVPELLAQLEHRAEGTSLMPGFLSLVLMLAVVEAMLANRHRAA